MPGAPRFHINQYVSKISCAQGTSGRVEKIACREDGGYDYLVKLHRMVRGHTHLWLSEPELGG